MEIGCRNAQQAVDVLLARFLSVPVDAGTRARIGKFLESELGTGDLVAANTGESAVLEKAEQLGLKRTTHIADFIEKDRAAFSLFHAAVLLPQSASERTFLVAEQFAFQE